jgi:hypothetical protein
VKDVHSEEKSGDYYCGGQSRPSDEPTAIAYYGRVEACANARKKRGWDFGANGGVKARIDGSKKRLPFCKGGPARRASDKMRAQFVLRRGPRSSCLD